MKGQALFYEGNPVDQLAPLTKAGVPIFAVIGAADELVPVSENIDIVEKHYLELGGEIQVIRKPGGKHHPHSLSNSTPSWRSSSGAIAERSRPQGGAPSRA